MSAINWIELRAENDLENLQQESMKGPVLIFKHSHRCHISRASLDRLERHWRPEEMDGLKTYFLDLLNYREISDRIARIFGVEHESPQVLLIRDGKSIFDQSHFGISYDDIVARVKN